MAAAPIDRSASCAMAVMGKASVPGRVKTRLVPPLNARTAASLNTAFLQDMVGNVSLANGSAPISPLRCLQPCGKRAVLP